MNEYSTPEHAEAYLAAADTIPHRAEGEAVLLELLPRDVRRVLDLGCGDGRLLALVLRARPGASGVAVDFSPPLLAAARARFAGRPDVSVLAHDLEFPLSGLSAAAAPGAFDLIVSSFAIHHVGDERKRALYAEAFALLTPGGLFCNLEHVASPTPALHAQFYAALGTTPEEGEDPSNRLAPVEEQLGWLREAGFEDVDCFWKWRELALLAGTRPGGAGEGAG